MLFCVDLSVGLLLGQRQVGYLQGHACEERKSVILQLLRAKDYSAEQDATWILLYKFPLKAVVVETVAKVKLQLKTSKWLNQLKRIENKRLQIEIEQLKADNVALRETIRSMGKEAEQSRKENKDLKAQMRRILELQSDPEDQSLETMRAQLQAHETTIRELTTKASKQNLKFYLVPNAKSRDRKRQKVEASCSTSGNDLVKTEKPTST